MLILLRAMVVAALAVALPQDLHGQIVNGVVFNLSTESILLARRGPPDRSGRNADGLKWHQWGEWVVYFDPAKASVAVSQRYLPERTVTLARARQTYGAPVRSRMNSSMQKIVEFAGDTVLVALNDDSKTIQYVEFGSRMDLQPVIGEHGMSWTRAFYERLASNCRSAPQPKDRLPFRSFVKATAQSVDSESGITLDSAAATRREIFVAINFLRMEGSSVPEFCVKAARTRDRVLESLRLIN